MHLSAIICCLVLVSLFTQIKSISGTALQDVMGLSLNDDNNKDLEKKSSNDERLAIFTRSESSSPQLRRQLRQKRKKLRRLRSEVRVLREKLHEFEGPKEENDALLPLPSMDESAAAGPKKVPDPVATVEGKKWKKQQRKKHRKRGWRKELLKQLRKLNRRLDSLGRKGGSGEKNLMGPSETEATKILVEQAETALRGSRKRKRKNRKNKGNVEVGKAVDERRRKKKRKNRLMSRTPEQTEEDRERMAQEELRYKLSILHTSRNQSKRGEEGHACQAHKDCRPGLCCHEVREKSEGVGGVERVKSECVSHALEVGGACADSCQCASGMHCYASRRDIRVQRDTVASDNEQGVCKVAATADFMHGNYLNAKNAIFRLPEQEE